MGAKPGWIKVHFAVLFPSLWLPIILGEVLQPSFVATPPSAMCVS